MISELGTHVMILEKTHPSGAEEWYCPTCRRRMLLQWSPAFELIVLESGDQHAQHSGSKGGLQIGAPQVEDGAAISVAQIEDDEVSEESLRLWLDALDDIELDDLGDEQVA